MIYVKRARGIALGFKDNSFSTAEGLIGRVTAMGVECYFDLFHFHSANDSSLFRIYCPDTGLAPFQVTSGDISYYCLADYFLFLSSESTVSYFTVEGDRPIYLAYASLVYQK